MGEYGQEVVVFSIEDLKRHVSDFIRQQILSLGANFTVKLRFEEIRKYSSGYKQDPNEVLYVFLPGPLPGTAVATTPHPTPEVLAVLILKLATVFEPTGTIATASAALPPISSSTTSVIVPPSPVVSTGHLVSSFDNSTADTDCNRSSIGRASPSTDECSVTDYFLHE